MEFVGPKDNQLTAFCLDKESYHDALGIRIQFT